MKRQILLISIALLLGNSPAGARNGIPLIPNPNAPKAAQRIRPAAASLYDYTIGKEPYWFDKYDIWGNRTERLTHHEAEGYDYIGVSVWDNSKGYPILLDLYSYEVYSEGSKGEPLYSRRTTLDASGVRTSLYMRLCGIFAYNDYMNLDAEGHLTSYVYKDDKYEMENYDLTWNGDLIATFKHDFTYAEPATSEMCGRWLQSEDLTNIKIVHQTKPFNAYDVMRYYELFEYPQESGIWISADGTGKCERFTNDVPDNDNCSGPMQIRSTVSEDKKRLTKTVTIDGKLIRYDEVVYIDENGSHTHTYTYRDRTSHLLYTYNEYGDLISFTVNPNSAKSDSTLYEWKYDADGRPLEVREYYKSYLHDKKEPKEAYVFTAWHDGSSVTSTAAGDSRILGATLYTIDGTKVRTLTTEEAQSIETVTAPQRGIYLLMMQTDRGIETRKIVL